MFVSEQSCPASILAVESLISELSDIPTPRTCSAIGQECVISPILLRIGDIADIIGEGNLD